MVAVSNCLFIVVDVIIALHCGILLLAYCPVLASSSISLRFCVLLLLHKVLDILRKLKYCLGVVNNILQWNFVCSKCLFIFRILLACLSSATPIMETHYSTLGILPLEVKGKLSLCHDTCKHCETCKPLETSRDYANFLVKIENHQEAFVTMEEAGVVVALAWASSGSTSLLGSSV